MVVCIFAKFVIFITAFRFLFSKELMVVGFYFFLCFFEMLFGCYR